jgi:hypothetical protein
MRMFHSAPQRSPPINPAPRLYRTHTQPSIQVTCQESDGTTLFNKKRFKARPTETHADLLSTLPFDVTSHIFCHACKPTFHGNRKWQRDCDPLLLGQLSRRYRQYAWATSELWTTIIIQVLPSKVAVQTELLEEWLARTTGRPIDIYFEIDTRLPTRWEELKLLSKPSLNNRPSVIPMIHLLAKHSLKWRRIEFHIPSTWYPIFTSSTEYLIVAPDNHEVQHISIPLDLPALISASLHSSDGVMTIARQAVELDLILAPSLRALSLSRFQISPIIFERVDFKQITNLTLAYVFGIKLPDLLPRLPNLQEATFHNTTFSQLQNQKFTHKKLCKLEIDVHQERLLLAILGYVILPRLEVLSVCIPTTMDYNTILRRFTIPSSECHITSLSLSCKITKEFHLIDVLSALDTLRELYIQDSSTEATPDFGLSRTFFDVFHPEEEPPQLPSLELFSYKGNLVVQAIDFLDPLVIRSRTRGGREGRDGNLAKFAVLRKVRIQADQVSNSADFSIAEYPDSQFIWEVMMMMERGSLELITMEGKCWE